MLDKALGARLEDSLSEEEEKGDTAARTEKSSASKAMKEEKTSPETRDRIVTLESMPAGDRSPARKKAQQGYKHSPESVSLNSGELVEKSLSTEFPDLNDPS